MEGEARPLLMLLLLLLLAAALVQTAGGAVTDTVDTGVADAAGEVAAVPAG